MFDRPDATAVTDRRAVDWERHKGHGGPKILRPLDGWEDGGSQPHRYYTRTTSFAKAIEDLSKLMDWKMRQVALGMGRWPAGVVAAAGLTADQSDRKALQELADQALAMAGGGDAALKGTALHTFTERLDRGEDLGHVPAELAPFLEAYRILTRPLSFLHREVRTVHDGLGIAGTPDAIGTCDVPDPDGVVDGLRIIDLKSGKVSYPGPMSCQLAAYAGSRLYDPATGTRTPLEGVNSRWGIIVHAQLNGDVPPGLYWLNLEHGQRGLELARMVRTWRRVKADRVLRPVAGYGPGEAVPLPETPPASSEAAEDVAAAAEAIVAAEQPTPHVCQGCDVPLAENRHADGCTFGPAAQARTAILGAITTGDLKVLWRDHGESWGDDERRLAADRHAELHRQERLAAPRAALAAALVAADGPTLHRLWTEHGRTPVWTEEHSQLSRDRHQQLTAAA